MSRQSKKARFAAKQRVRREHDRIIREHGHKPGFLGVTSNLRIRIKDGRTLHMSTGQGALFTAFVPYPGAQAQLFGRPINESPFLKGVVPTALT